MGHITGRHHNLVQTQIKSLTRGILDPRDTWFKPFAVLQQNTGLKWLLDTNNNQRKILPSAAELMVAPRQWNNQNVNMVEQWEGIQPRIEIVSGSVTD